MLSVSVFITHKLYFKVGQLAMEALLSLTSRRAGEWFKEELRQLGGLEHIVQTVNDCSKVIDFKVEWSPPMLDKLRKVDRCLRVLENVSFQINFKAGYKLLQTNITNFYTLNS